MRRLVTIEADHGRPPFDHFQSGEAAHSSHADDRNVVAGNHTCHTLSAMLEFVLMRSIIITGAGSGIGRATALACAKRGDQVVALDRRSEEHTSELQSLRHLVCRLLL